MATRVIGCLLKQRAAGLVVSLMFYFLIFSYSASAHSWKEIHQGLDYTQVAVKLENISVNLHVLKINLKNLEIKPIVIKTKKSVREMRENFGALAVINANFFDESGKVLGLVVKDNVTLSQKKNISWWSVFCIQKNSAQIFHTKNYDPGQCSQAIQTGPRLVTHGMNPKLKPETSRKTVVALNRKGEVFFILANEKIPILDLARFLKTPESQGGLGMAHALNLDGGSSTQMSLKTKNFSLEVPSFMSIPVGLGVFEK